MNNFPITVGGATVSIPDYYQVVDSIPDDPPASTPIMTQTSMGTAFVLLYPMPSEHAMPPGDARSMIDGVRASLADDQGIVQVENGRTHKGMPFTFSIVKTRIKERGLQYGLTLDVGVGDHAIRVQGFFDEGPTTGVRAAATYSLLRDKGIIDADGGNWMADPYDPTVRHGFLANLGESPEFDDLFPEHPLSLARSMIAQISASL